MKYQIIEQSGTELKVVDNVDEIVHKDGYFYFIESYTSNPEKPILYVAADSEVAEISKID